MAVKVEHLPPRSRSNRFSLGLGLRSNSSQRRASEKRSDDRSDAWYIPYNGPIERPRPTSPELRPRDSWGDLINTYGTSIVLKDSDINSRHDAHRGDARLDSGDSDQVKMWRNRALSGASYRSTSSSGAADPHRIANTVPRRPTVTRAGAQPISYSSSSDTGGVGESPMPVQRLAQNAASSHRVSLTNLFSFSGSSRKSRSPPSKTIPFTSPPPASETHISPPLSFPTLSRTNSRTEGRRDQPKTRGRREKTRVDDPVDPHKTTEEAYFDSYYSTLISPKADAQASHRPSEFGQRHQASGSQSNSTAQKFPSLPAPPSLSHPYAQVSTQAERRTVEQSLTVRRQTSDTGISLNQRQKPATVQPPISRPSISNSSGRPRQLRSSVSSPDLYAAARTINTSHGSSTKPKPTYTNKDRWLAIETWCDAVVFPRPRFYVQQGDEKRHAMIITPPGTPIAGNVVHRSDQHQIQEKIPPSMDAIPALQSRVLWHSRSQQDLRHHNADTGSSSLPVKSRRRGATLPNGSAREYPLTRNITTTTSDSGIGLAQPRPSVQDRARSPSPVLSLDKVLQEGQELNEMRQKWQMQATQSFQNKRTRSISRTRSKSLGSRDPRYIRKEGETSKVMESIDYLATRTFLGNQSTMPTVHPSKPRSERGFGTGTMSSKSHSHSSSLAKSSSKSSKASVQRGHSRNESWGHSALKYAKSTAVSLCGFSEAASLSPQDYDAAGREGGPQGDAGTVQVPSDSETKPLLPATAKPTATSETPFDPQYNRWRVSPAPSGSYEAVGIALSTPPPFNDRDSPSHEDDPISLPDHPYGQVSLTQHSQMAPPVTYRRRDSWRGSDYAGPHPTTSNMVVQGDISDVAVRHRLPPQAILHPYAQAAPSIHHSVEDAMNTRVRAGPSNHHAVEDAMNTPVRSEPQIPAGERMWMRLSPGGMREILPNEIEYSPFETTPVATKAPEHIRKTRSTVSVGEALTSAMRLKDGMREARDMYPTITFTEEPEKDTEANQQAEVKADTAPLRLGRMRHPYRAASPAKLTPTESEAMLDSPLRDQTHSSGSSPGIHSQSSSPQISPRPLGSMDDLDNFRDLFYRPTARKTDVTGSIGTGPSTLSWEMSSHRNGSGLTSLARQLSVELDELNARYDPAEGTPLEQSPDGMQFILSESRGSGSLRDMRSSSMTLDREKLFVFQPSFNVPEDVESSRDSSLVRRSPEDETETGPIRLGVVESSSLPVTTTIPIPLSGHISLMTEDASESEDEAPDEDTTVRLRRPRSQPLERQPLSASLLLPTSAEPTRSSYMTTSTNGSRMSGLSDFPAPPGDVAGHMRLMESYLAAGSENASEGSHGTQRAPLHRMTFGVDEYMDDLAEALATPER